MTTFDVVSRGHLSKRSRESGLRGIAKLVERLTRTVAVWPDASDRANYAKQRETAPSDDCHELDLLFQSPEPIR